MEESVVDLIVTELIDQVNEYKRIYGKAPDHVYITSKEYEIIKDNSQSRISNLCNIDHFCGIPLVIL